VTEHIDWCVILSSRML